MLTNSEGVVETWPTFPFESDRNDRNTYVFSIETKGFRGSKLEWLVPQYDAVIRIMFVMLLLT